MLCRNMITRQKSMIEKQPMSEDSYMSNSGHDDHEAHGLSSDKT